MDSYRQQSLSPERFESIAGLPPTKRKVSEIAHLFQATEVRRSKSDVFAEGFAPNPRRVKHHDSRDELDDKMTTVKPPASLMRGSSSLSTSALPTTSSSAAAVSAGANVRRTESQAARFNSARALFEKLGSGQQTDSKVHRFDYLKVQFYQ